MIHTALEAVLVLLLGAAGCRAESPDELETTSTSGSNSTGTEPSSRVGTGADPGDPFVGIEALRPEPWTAWPLENIDVELETGWRIDVTTGEFALEQGLVLAADPGALVLAIAPGEVAELRRSGPEPDAPIELIVDHGDGIQSHYAPLVDGLVHVGLPVTRGSAIALARGPTLRLVVTIDGLPIDPALVLRQPLHRWPALLRTRPAPIP